MLRVVSASIGSISGFLARLRTPVVARGTIFTSKRSRSLHTGPNSSSELTRPAGGSPDLDRCIGMYLPVVEPIPFIT
ncbi:hypothetical protein B0H11DRAFT_241489 [Mycena galericulata]|nr:hypothetical protein B0H11DRAFT_241489 [Mycena galericulata]